MIANKLTIFCLSHNNELLEKIPNRNDLRKINLSDLKIDKFQRNEISESRAIIAKAALDCETEYAGYVTARWNQKYENLCPLEDLKCLNYQLNSKTVFAPSIEEKGWLYSSNKEHPGIGRLVSNVALNFDINPENRTLFANNFICHRDVMKDFHEKWQIMFDYAFKLHGFNPKFNNKSKLYDSVRHAGYFYERLTCLYFASRTDLNLVKIMPKSNYKVLII